MALYRQLGQPLVVLAAALVVLPHLMAPIGMTYAVASEIAVFALVGLGFNLLLGYTGLVSFGHGAFFGLAAYAVALSQLYWFKDGFWLPLVFGVAFAGGLGLASGFLILRRRGVYFSLLTLALTAMIYYIVFRWTSFTGGENGLRGMTRPAVFGIDMASQFVFYHLVAAFVFAGAVLAWRIVNSPVGRVLVAIRENEPRAVALGYPVQRYKLVAFTLSASIAGLGGALFAFLKIFVWADLVHVNASGEILVMSIIGGMRNFLGPALGSLFFVLFRDTLSEITPAWQLWFGLLFMGFILFSPTGLMGIAARVREMVRPRPELAAAMAARVQPAATAPVPEFLASAALGAGCALACGSISKSFGGISAVADVSIEVAGRGVHALIGPNGAGKTTLFNLASGLIPVDRGEIRFRGARIDGLPAHAVAGRGLTRSFQITKLFKALTVRENLRLAVQARHRHRFAALAAAAALADVNAETDGLIEFLGLAGLEEVPAENLSYGGQRLVDLGIALAGRPALVMLDEPLAGLAAAERDRVGGLIRRLGDTIGVLVVEHDIDRVLGMADRVTVMNQGGILLEGSAEEVRADRRVHEVYLGSGAARRAERAASTAGAPLLTAVGVNAYYGKSHILTDVDFEVSEREVVAVLGRNGAGKSTLLKSLIGLVPPRPGSIKLGGREIAGSAPEAIARLGIGYVPQGRRLFAALSVAENLHLGRLRRQTGEGLRWDDERIFEFFPRIRERYRVAADLLSGGEQQMVAIARALAGNLRVLLLDEPFEGLAPAVTEELFATVDKLRQEIAVVVVDHNLDLVLALADRVVVLDRGHVVYRGPAVPLRRDFDLRRRVLWV